ncbi:MAG TPA: hypothetical protein VMG31_04145 [Verrucomicrobiae bacterium]|nr:hypothetical protein [Verrucomicrobiae bacterium]
MMEFIARFLIGGFVVSCFAILGDMLQPKSFAGLTSAAPSIALATISLTVAKSGRLYAATEARSMILGAAAFLVYAWIVCTILMRRKWFVVATAYLALGIWLICALALQFLILG